MSAPKAKAIAETWLKVMLCSRTSSHTSFRVFRSPCWSHYTIVCHLVVSAKVFGVFTLHDWPSNGSVHTTRLSISSHGRLLCKTHARSDKANERNAMCGLMFSLKTWMWSRKEPSGSFVLFRVHVCKNQKERNKEYDSSNGWVTSTFCGNPCDCSLFMLSWPDWIFWYLSLRLRFSLSRLFDLRLRGVHT